MERMQRGGREVTKQRKEYRREATRYRREIMDTVRDARAKARRDPVYVEMLLDKIVGLLDDLDYLEDQDDDLFDNEVVPLMMRETRHGAKKVDELERHHADLAKLYDDLALRIANIERVTFTRTEAIEHK